MQLQEAHSDVGASSRTSECLRTVLSCIIAATLVACGNKQSQRDGTSIHPLKTSEMSAAERKYGIAPIADPSVTYQPDVILVGGGPEAIRDQNPNGFIWTIDGNAPHANELEPGKIFFMTGRAVGRVLDVRKSGSELIVTVGPADITDIIREAHIHIKEMPVDFGDAIPYSAPDYPGRVVPIARVVPQPGASPAIFATSGDWRLQKTQSPVSPPLRQGTTAPFINLNNFTLTPKVSLTGIGVDVKTDQQGFKFDAQAVLHLLSPRLTVDIDITPFGGVTTAQLQLTGAAGLNWHFEIGYAQKTGANINVLMQPDVDFQLPIVPIHGIPLAITLRQRFEVKTGVLVENSTLSADGGYTFTGAFKVGYTKGQGWSPPSAPHDYTTEQSMTKTGEGISLGLQGLTLAHSLKVIVGLGSVGFAAGPYFTFQSAIGAFRNSSAGMLQCKGATLVVSLIGGVGYVIPKVIEDLINSVLSVLNIKYRITGEGGIQPSKPGIVINKTSQLGGCPKIPDASDATGTVRGGP